MLTSKLSWNEHTLNVIVKTNKRMLILRSYKNFLPRKALIQIYKTMIRPIIEYIDALYSNAPLSLCNMFENIQRQAAVICTGAYHHTSYNALLNDLAWESLERRQNTHKLVLFYKIYHRIYPKYLYNHLCFTPETNYNLRNQKIIKL